MSETEHSQNLSIHDDRQIAAILDNWYIDHIMGG